MKLSFLVNFWQNLVKVCTFLSHFHLLLLILLIMTNCLKFIYSLLYNLITNRHAVGLIGQAKIFGAFPSIIGSQQQRSQDIFGGETIAPKKCTAKIKNLKPRKSHDALDFHIHLTFSHFSFFQNNSNLEFDFCLNFENWEVEEQFKKCVENFLWFFDENL